MHPTRRGVKYIIANRGSESEGDDEAPRFRPIRPSLRGPRSQHDLSSPSSTNSPAEEPLPPPTPALETPDRTPIKSPNLPNTSNRTLILVTADSERYVNVDITDARDPTYIRECVFSKLNIYDEEDQARFSIYQTEIGAYAIGEALSDEKLFELCNTLGDSKGTLKLLVSHSSAPIHEPHIRPLPSFAPPVNTIPPPVLPQPSPQPYPPLRPNRHHSSRNDGSVSSVGEPVELAAGYEADLDNNTDRDSNRNTIRPPPTSSIVPPSPLSARRPTAPFSSRPNSPPPQTPPVNHPPNTIIDKFGNVIPTPPPPPPFPPPPLSLSPNRSSFFHEDNNITPRSHLRTGSDAATEREKYFADMPKSLRPQHQLTSNRLIPEPSQYRDHLRPRNRDYDDGSWILVAKSEGTRSEQEPLPTPPESSRPAKSIRTHVSPTRYTKVTGKLLNIPAAPRHPPPAVPTTSTNEPRPSRTAGQPVPLNWPITWKGEEKGLEQRPLPSSSNFHKLAKGAKSMDNLRAVASYGSHPTTLQPGASDRSRRPPNVSTPRANGSVPYPNPSTTSISRPVRPLPIQGNPMQTLSPEAVSPFIRTPIGFASPNQDPYPRPQSALGDTVASPTQTQKTNNQRLYHSPSQVFDAESARTPGSFMLSPSHPYIPNGITGARSTTALSEFYNDAYHSSRSSPPHSPHNTDSPANSYDRMNGSDTVLDLQLESKRNSNATLKKEDRAWLSNMIDKPSEVTLIPSSSNKQSEDSFLSTSLPTTDTSTLSSYGTFTSFRSASSADSDGDTSTSLSLWNRPPAPDQRSQRPPLTVQIETSNGMQPVSIPSSGQSSQQGSRAPSTTPTPMHSLTSSSPSPTSRARKAKSRASAFGAAEDEDESTWAPRPPPEDVYERLEEYFPEHDLDKPIIEAGSGGTSPTAADPSPALPVPSPPERSRIKGKKSIRIVAEEHKKRIDRTSRTESSTWANVMRKRSTKLWGSRIEEVTTDRSKEKAPVPAHPESPSGPSKSSFAWVKGGLIGRGTYGRVYLAMNATTGEMMAVKQVEMPHTASDRNDSRQVTVVQALKMESETLKDLDHPNIVQYLGFEETPENLSIFLEYVPGGSIGSVLNKHGKFAENVVKSFTAQILAGLEYLHSKGILHRDLKADNILVEMSGVCKISDFGISKRTDDLGGAVTAMQGTVFWMAPEVVNPSARGYYNFKADIWSVGCVVLEMWAGMRPWQGDEMVAVMFKLYSSKTLPPVPANVVLSELGDDFRMKCFAINPDERPSAAELRTHPYLQLPPGWQFIGFT